MRRKRGRPKGRKDSRPRAQRLRAGMFCSMLTRGASRAGAPPELVELVCRHPFKPGYWRVRRAGGQLYAMRAELLRQTSA